MLFSHELISAYSNNSLGTPQQRSQAYGLYKQGLGVWETEDGRSEGNPDLSRPQYSVFFFFLLYLLDLPTKVYLETAQTLPRRRVTWLGAQNGRPGLNISVTSPPLFRLLSNFASSGMYLLLFTIPPPPRPASRQILSDLSSDEAKSAYVRLIKVLSFLLIHFRL